MKWHIEEILRQYDIVFEDVQSYRDGFLLENGGRKYILKPVDAPKERIETIGRAKEHIISNGFNNIERYIKSISGEFYSEIDDIRYILTKFTVGRDCDFDSDLDISASAAALAEFHEAGKNFQTDSPGVLKNDLYKLTGTYRKRLEDIRKMRKTAKKGQNEFDRLYIMYSKHFENIGQEALEILEKSAYTELCETAEREGAISHNDYTHYNIKIGPDGRGYILNMENIGHDIYIYDLVNFIRRKMRKCSWNYEKCKFLTEEYSKIREITAADKTVAAAMLQFPQKFWRTANTYYNSKRGWVEKGHIKKLEESIAEMKDHYAFMEKWKL